MNSISSNVNILVDDVLTTIFSILGETARNNNNEVSERFFSQGILDGLSKIEKKNLKSHLFKSISSTESNQKKKQAQYIKLILEEKSIENATDLLLKADEGEQLAKLDEEENISNILKILSGGSQENPLIKSVIDKTNHYIRSYFTIKIKLDSGFENLFTVSKLWNTLAIPLKKKWVEQNLVPLKTYNCLTIPECIACISRNNLKTVVFPENLSIDQNALDTLIKEAPDLLHLEIILKNVKNFELSKLKNLETLKLNQADSLSIVISEKLANLKSLYIYSEDISDDAEHVIPNLLRNAPNLKKLFLCIDAIEYDDYTFLNTTSITHLDVGILGQNNPEQLLKTIFKMKQLKALELNGFPIKFQHLEQLVKSLPNLEYLGLYMDCMDLQYEDSESSSDDNGPLFEASFLFNSLKNLQTLNFYEQGVCYQRDEKLSDSNEEITYHIIEGFLDVWDLPLSFSSRSIPQFS